MRGVYSITRMKICKNMCVDKKEKCVVKNGKNNGSHKENNSLNEKCCILSEKKYDIRI